MRPVLLPGGLLVLTTSGAGFMRFQELHNIAACHFGYMRRAGIGLVRFGSPVPPGISSASVHERSRCVT
jgi:hypothetical protein